MKNSSIIKLTAIGGLVAMLFTGCVTPPAVTPQPTASPTACPTPEQTEAYIEPVDNFIQKPDTRDWTLMWWRDGYDVKYTDQRRLNIQTGYYGVQVDPFEGTITKMGAIADELTQTQAACEDNARIEGLAGIDGMDYCITFDGQEKRMTAISVIDKGESNDVRHNFAVLDEKNTATSRIIDSGRYMQSTDIMNLNYKGEKDITGRVEISAMPRYLSIDYSLWSRTGKRTGGLAFSITLSSEYTDFEFANYNKVLACRRADGSGITFVLPDIIGASMALDGDARKITFNLKSIELKKCDFCGFNIIAIPSLNASVKDADEYYNNSAVTASATQISPYNGRSQKVQFTDKGYLSISLNNMMTYMGADFAGGDDRLDEMDRLAFTVTNNKNTAVKLPVQFIKTNKLGVLGLSPFLRDAETGEPTGVQVQLSKNWHEPAYYVDYDPATYLTGYWFHGYTYIEIPANSTVTYEFCMTYAKWGGVFASSHSQICLAGWGGNYQLWETTAIGSFGESFCYDAEMIHDRGYITDIRPLLVTSIYGGKYNWTENVGGGNFLYYNKAKGQTITKYKNVRVQLKKQGPNLTEAIYRGITVDDAVKYEIIANLPRTDDVSKVYHTFTYTFLKDVTFERLSFYQFGSEYYNDNHWDRMAIGNDDGTVDITIDGTTYSGDFDLPDNDIKNAYYIGSKNEMQRVEIPGEGLWTAFMGYAPCNYKVNPGANRMLVLLDFSAELNGRHYDKPTVSLYHTNDGGQFPCMSVELTPAKEVGNTIKAGSTVTGTVMWLNLPVEKSDYYGPSGVLNAMPEDWFNTSRLAYAYATGTKTATAASTGTVIKQYPVYVKCAGTQSTGETAAEITVTGGISYVPLTFTNVKTYSGYALQQFVDGEWIKVDQSTFGNDYWQAWYDDETDTYELTFNVEHTGNIHQQYRYRLIKEK